MNPDLSAIDLKAIESKCGYLMHYAINTLAAKEFHRWLYDVNTKYRELAELIKQNNVIPTTHPLWIVFSRESDFEGFHGFLLAIHQESSQIFAKLDVGQDVLMRINIVKLTHSLDLSAEEPS